MRWNSSNLIPTMRSLFRISLVRRRPQPVPTIDSIRQAMLNALGASGADRYPVIQLRVSHAHDIQDLWYLRGDIMGVLAGLEGEVSARRKLNEITAMFRGLMPPGMNSRPSPLSA